MASEANCACCASTSGLEELDNIAFQQRRRAAWEQNSAAWRGHTEGDETRAAVYGAVLSLLKEYSGGLDGRLIVDVACGAAGFLHYAAMHFPGTGYHGFDASEGMLEVARSTAGAAARLSQLDLEQHPLPALPGGAFVCLYAAFEFTGLDTLFKNISAGMGRGDVLVLNVFDPLVEAARHLRHKSGKQGASFLMVDGRLGTASHFRSGGQVSPQPYYRILHPLDAYLAAASGASLSLEAITTAGPGGDWVALNTPRNVILVFRK